MAVDERAGPDVATTPAATGGTAASGGPAARGGYEPVVLDAPEPGTVLTGPLGRWAARYPLVLDMLIATGYVLVMLGLAVVGALGRYTPVALLGVAQTLVLGGLLLLRRRAPVALLVCALVVPTLTRLGDSGLETDPPVVTVWTYDPSAPLPVFDVLSTPRIAPMEIVAVAILVLTIAIERSGRTTLVASLGAALYGVVSYLVFGGEGGRLLDGAEAVGVIIVAALVGSNLRDRLRRVIELDDRARRLALERDQREQIAVSSERTRIAREMHDVLAHSLSVMVTLADGAARTMDRDPARARAALDRLAGAGRDALADTRRMVGILREDARPGRPSGGDGDLPGVAAPMAPQPAAEDLKHLVRSFHDAGLPVRLALIGPPLPQDATLQLTVYRIVQECLTNVLRYAPDAPSIKVRVAHSAGHVTITVDNTSGGTAAAGGSGRGLIGIRERAAVFDGTVVAGPTANGWRVEARLRVDNGTTEAQR